MIQGRTKLYNRMSRGFCNTTERKRIDEDQENDENGSDFDGTIKYEAENVIGSDEMNICTGSDFVCTPENEVGSDDAIASAEKNIASSLKTMAITNHKEGLLKEPNTELQMIGITVMAGYLKKRLSILKGYRDQWIVLADDGYLKHFNEKPIYEDQKPRTEILLLLSDTFVNEDGVSFTVISASKRVFRLRADHNKKRNEWIEAINYARSKLYNRMFKGFHDPGESKRTYSDLDQVNDSKEIDDVFQPENETDVDDVIAVAETNIVPLFQTKCKRPFVAVGAIELGNTTSGCAFSTVQDFKTNPLRIHAFQLDDTNVYSYKTSSVLLLTPEGRFHSFGATAEDHYVSLNEEANSWYYFNSFKMQLYKKDLTSDMVIKEVGGKTMKAMVVFAFCIEYIKDKVLDRLSKAIYDLDDDDVHWVVTVQAIWNDQARQFMIEASAKAGIEKENLTLALEPECAAMYCRYLAMDKKERGDNMEIKAFDKNARFMMIDFGGRTINITVLEVLSTGQFREIFTDTGCPWGGNYINDQIMKTLKEVIGWEKMRRFQAEDYDDYLEILRQVEKQKRGVDHYSKFTVKLPNALLKNIKVPDLYKQYVQIEKKRITFSASIMQTICSPSVDSTIKQVEGILQREEACSVSTIMLVGGYSASKVIQHAFREKFEKNYRIIIPLSPDMIVLKGAVITGHRVESIVGRMAKYHYGLGLSAAAVSGRSISIGDNDNKKFFSLIKKGQTIKVGEVVTQYEVVLKAKSRWANLEMYTTKDDNPVTIIDKEHFTKIGRILVKLPQYKRESILILTISYDETEFKVVATDKNTGRCFVGTCSFLEKETDQNSS